MRRVGRGADRRSCAAIGAGRAGLDRAGRRRARRGRSQQFRDAFDRAPRRLRRRAEVSAAVASCCSCCASTRGPAHATARDMALRDAARDGARRHARSHRRRLSSLLGRRRLARAALREDALRPGAARARVSSRRRRRPAIRSTLEVAEDTLRYVHARDDRPGRRLLFGRGRRQRPAGTRRRRRTRTRRKARSTSGAPTRSTRCSATTPRVVKQRFGIEPDGNAPPDPQQEFTGKNLLYVARSIDELAQQTGTTGRRDRRGPEPRAACAMFQRALERPRPHLDDKMLTAWNGLMIAAFARMARVLARARRRRTRGRRAVSRGRAPRGGVRPRAHVERRRPATLLRRYRDGHAEIEALRRGLRVPDLRAARAVSGRPRPEWLEWAIDAAAPAGRAVLGRGRRRLVQHDRAAIRASCCG